MRTLLLLAAFALPGLSAAQIPSSLSGDPRVQAERQRSDAAARAAMASQHSRQTDLTSRNLALDRQAPPAVGARDAARTDLARQRTEAEQQAEADELRRLQQERLRMERIDPAAAPR